MVFQCIRKLLLYIIPPQNIVVKNNNYLFPVLWVSDLGWAGLSWDGSPLPHVVWLKIKVTVLVAQSCPTLCSPVDCNLAGLSGTYLGKAGQQSLSPGGPHGLSSSRRLVQMSPLGSKRDRSEQPQSFNE